MIHGMFFLKTLRFIAASSIVVAAIVLLSCRGGGGGDQVAVANKVPEEWVDLEAEILVNHNFSVDFVEQNVAFSAGKSIKIAVCRNVIKKITPDGVAAFDSEIIPGNHLAESSDTPYSATMTDASWVTCVGRPGQKFKPGITRWLTSYSRKNFVYTNKDGKDAILLEVRGSSKVPTRKVKIKIKFAEEFLGGIKRSVELAAVGIRVNSFPTASFTLDSLRRIKEDTDKVLSIKKLIDGLPSIAIENREALDKDQKLEVEIFWEKGMLTGG
jgi:hypothetical protein